jgi:magnesium transporter
MLHSLEQRDWTFFKNEDMEVYFGDIGDHLNKIWDTLEDYREFVDNLSDASNWLTSNRIQGVMRILAIVAACAAPLAVIVGLYGMNIRLPGDLTTGSWVTLPVVIVVMLCILGIMLYFFHRKHWL